MSKGCVSGRGAKGDPQNYGKEGSHRRVSFQKFDKFFTRSVAEYGRIEDGELLFGWIEKQGYNVVKDPILKKPIPFLGETPEWLKQLVMKPIKSMNVGFLVANAKHMLFHPRTETGISSSKF